MMASSEKGDPPDIRLSKLDFLDGNEDIPQSWDKTRWLITIYNNGYYPKIYPPLSLSVTEAV